MHAVLGRTKEKPGSTATPTLLGAASQTQFKKTGTRGQGEWGVTASANSTPEAGVYRGAQEDALYSETHHYLQF